MSPTVKRLLLIFGFLVLVFVIGYALYAVFVKRPTSGTTTGGTTGGTGTSQQFPSSTGRIPTTGTGATSTGSLPIGTTIGQNGGTVPTYYQQQPTVQITSDFSAFPSISNKGGVRYYNQADGKFYRITANGTPVALSDQVFYNAKNVTWANVQDKAIIEYPDGSKILYNFATKQQVSLPKHWEDFSFSPDSSEFAAKSMGLSPDNRWLVTSKDDGTGTKAIEPLGNNGDKVTIDWSPSRQTVAFSQTGQAQGGERQEVLFVGLNGENFKSAIVEGIDFQPSWSPTGKRLLYSIDNAASKFKPDLWIVDSYGDSIGNNRIQLQLNTWADKCSFSDDNTLFCAVPQSLPEGAGMSPAIANDIADTLYKIDLRTGLKIPLQLDDSYTITNLNFDKTSNKLFFTDPHRSGIFQVNI